MRKLFKKKKEQSPDNFGMPDGGFGGGGNVSYDLNGFGNQGGGGFGQPSMLPPGGAGGNKFGQPSMLPPGGAGGNKFGQPSMLPPGGAGGNKFGQPSMLPPGGAGGGFGQPSMLPPGGAGGGGRGFGDYPEADDSDYDDSDSDLEDYGSFRSPGPGFNPYGDGYGDVPPPRSAPESGFDGRYDSTSEDEDEYDDDSDSSYYNDDPSNQFNKPAPQNNYAAPSENYDSRDFDAETTYTEDYENNLYGGEYPDENGGYYDDEETLYEESEYDPEYFNNDPAYANQPPPNGSPGMESMPASQFGFGDGALQDALAGLKKGPTEGERAQMKGEMLNNFKRQGFGGATSVKLKNLRAGGLNHVSFNFNTGKTKAQEKSPPAWAKKAKRDRAGMTNLERDGVKTGGDAPWKNLQLKKGPRPMTTTFTPKQVRKPREDKSEKSRAPELKNSKHERKQKKKPARDPEWKQLQLKPSPRPMTTMYSAPPSQQSRNKAKAGSPKEQKPALPRLPPASPKGSSSPKASSPKASSPGNESQVKGKGDGCYLMFDKSKGGTLYAQWAAEGISSSVALGYFRPNSPAPRFNYKKNEGRVDILSGVQQSKKKYFEGWTYFWLMAREVGGRVTVLGRTKKSDYTIEIWTLDRKGTPSRVRTGRSVDSSKIEYIAAVPHGTKAFENMDNVAPKVFMSTAQKSGECVQLE